jgi:hypothetical protein
MGRDAETPELNMAIGGTYQQWIDNIVETYRFCR